ncbi:MAG: respiratory nitrate reductase subunit gamma [Selenomonadaceae bacterium]|nr:respiratory nitrate reductase subunit gamma [Selenomonadaceae bacterium]MBR1579876.1 respiratory nitrate reductase subunit gamma [Selenomonadaceae bacterium]
MNEFLWGALPYVAFTFLVIGTIVRYSFFERGWTTKSSQMLDKKSLMIAGPMFHLGLFMAFGGHVIGVLIPKFCTEAVGIDEHLYHIIAIAGGVPAGLLFFLGFFMLMQRRFSNPRVAVNTSKTDGVLYAILFVTIVTGLLSTAYNILIGFDYREAVSPWFRSLLMFSPDVSLMTDVPIIFKVHMLCWMLTGIIFPFTRLVHCLSFPFEYFGRSNIIYRRK